MWFKAGDSGEPEGGGLGRPHRGDRAELSTEARWRGLTGLCVWPFPRKVNR